jgi:lipopolysaccharide/colanic/teichoic acid biosynthesis glycosyltransferase/NDP-sugar pyrophosphorylase family protein
MNPPPSTAVILAGGLATFSGNTIAPVPKFFLPVCNCPLYQYWARILGLAGVEKLIICVSAEHEALAAKHLSLSPPPLNCLVRKTSLGTGGSLKEVAEDIRGDTFWVVSGDLLVQADLSLMWSFHQEHQAMATVAAITVETAPWETGRVELDGDGKVRAIHRIHPFHEKRSKLRPSGLYLFAHGVLDLIPPDSYFDLKEQIFPVLYHLQAATVAWEIPGYGQTIASLDDYFQVNRDIILKRVLFEGVRGLPEDFAAADLPPGINSSVTRVPPYVIGAGSQIDEGVLILGPAVIGPDCEIQAGAVINNSVILGNAMIGPMARVDNCLVGESGVIGGGGDIREQTVVADIGQASRKKSRGIIFGSVEWQVPTSRFYLTAKRLLDIVFSALLLVLFSPILLAAALAIKLDSPGPVFFRQVRCGKKGKDFIMFKFRSMVSDAEDLKRELHAFNEVDGPMFKIMADPRITRVGKFLRDTNLDEIPQLWNVLKGDMSLVGPRPLSMEEMRYNPKWRDCRLAVLPGVTGLWQAKAHDKVFFNEWIRYDIEYVNHCSLWLDLKIVFLTVFNEIKNFLRKKRHNDTKSGSSSDYMAESSP